MNREVLDRYCERAIFAFVLSILILGPLAFGAVDTVPFLIIQGITLAVLALWIARLWLIPRPKLLWPPICWAVLAFTVYAVARYFTADIEYLARQELIRVLVYAILFFAVLNNLHRQEFTHATTYTLVFLAMAVSFYALYQYLAGSDRVWHVHSPYHHRASGTYISPNHLGGFLELILPLGLAFALASRLKPVGKILLGYAALVTMAGIAVTVSRGSWIAASMAVLLFFGILLLHRAHRLPAILLLMVIIAGGIFLVPKSQLFEARFRRLYETGKLDDDNRFDLWQPAVRMWRDHPWWGVGPDHFDARFPLYRPESVQVRPRHTHNDYLNALVDWGAVGAALIASAWVLLGLGVLKTWRFVRSSPRDIGGKNSSNRFAFVLGASIGLLAILFHSVVDFNMHIPANAILAVTLMALLSSYIRFATERFWVTAKTWTKAIATVVAVAGILFLGYEGWKRGSEEIWLARAAREPNFSSEQIASLTKAFAVEPMNGQTAYLIGEALRVRSQEGGERYEDFQGLTYRDLAQQAMGWFERSWKLNRWDEHPLLGYGWCLDWLERKNESGSFFNRADALDPNSYFTAASIGLHYNELGDYAASRLWFERSLRLDWQGNLIARSNLELANSRLAEAATNDVTAKLREALRQVLSEPGSRGNPSFAP